jgi:hypothetical protein
MMKTITKNLHKKAILVFLFIIAIAIATFATFQLAVVQPNFEVLVNTSYEFNVECPYPSGTVIVNGGPAYVNGAGHIADTNIQYITNHTDPSVNVGTYSATYTVYDNSGQPIDSQTFIWEVVDPNPPAVIPYVTPWMLNPTVPVIFAHSGMGNMGYEGQYSYAPDTQKTVSASAFGPGYYFAGWSTTGSIIVSNTVTTQSQGNQAFAVSATVNTGSSGGTVTANFLPIGSSYDGGTAPPPTATPVNHVPEISKDFFGWFWWHLTHLFG